MRHVMAGCVVVLLVGALGAAWADPKAKEGIEGTWQIVGAAERGKTVPAEKLKSTKFIISADKLTMSGLKKVADEYTYKIDAKAKPSTIDLTRNDSTTTGIYKLEGDTLTICLPRRGTTTRPDTFESKEGNGLTVFILKREK